MKKLFIIIIILLLFSVMVLAKLSDETLDLVEGLRLKHYGYNKYGGTFYNSNFVYIFDWWSMTFEDGKLFVTTQDGKWYIEMKEIKKGDD